MRGSQSVENMRAALMDLLGKGRERFLDFDEAYANALFNENYPGGNLGDILQQGHTRALRDQIPISDYEDAGGIGPRSASEQAQGRRIDSAVRAANILSRYALPAGGLTLAGKGLMDIIHALNVEDAMEYHDKHIMIPFNPDA